MDIVLWMVLGPAEENDEMLTSHTHWAQSFDNMPQYSVWFFVYKVLIDVFIAWPENPHLCLMALKLPNLAMNVLNI